MLLGELCSASMTPLEHLREQQALVKQLAHIIDFVSKFDELKMLNPSIQNDFSFYRRTISRISPNPNIASDLQPIKEMTLELSNKIIHFYAQANPMLKVISFATINFVTSHPELPVENTTETLGTMAKVCQRMIENR